MRTHTLRLTALITLILLMAGGQTLAKSWSRHQGIKGSGQLETRSFDLDTIDEIEIGGVFDVYVTFGDRQKVEITIDDNLWDNLEADVRGGTLDLDWDKGCSPDGKCQVNLVLRELKEVSIRGVGNVGIENFQGDSFTYSLSGAGNLDMDGEVDRLKIKISGAGDADTRELKARYANVSISGAGNARIYASESLRGRVSGVGNLSYWGNPEDTDTHVSGLGHIRRK